jgi:uncharacterized protein YndB with AHSA1/START domain
MTDQLTVAPVRTATLVEAPIERAFDVFTIGFGRWWPASHHTAGDGFEEAVLECREGGRWYERRSDGADGEWGTVLVWEPPHRIVLAWHLDADFKYDPDPARATEVEVRFTPDGPDRTRVELEHRLLERFGDRADETRRAIGSDGGWPAIMETFAAAASQRA